MTAAVAGVGPALWGRARASIRTRIGEPNYNAWIAPLRPSWVDGALALGAPDEATRERVARHFLRTIEDALAEAAGRACTVRLGIAPAATALPIPLRTPSREHTFARFLAGESNERALAAARGLVDEASFGALFLHGPSGVGKTHLLHAIFHALDAAGLLVACLATAELVEALVAAYAARADARFWADLHPLGALLLDDVHSVRGLDETQERLMAGLGAWVRAGRLLVLTSDRAPAELPHLVARLGDRIQGSVVTPIGPPEPALRIAILQQRAREHGVTLDARLAGRLAREAGGNVRRLEGALTRLVAHASLSGRPIDAELAAEVLSELARRPSQPATVERIVTATAVAFRVPSRRLRGRSQSAGVLGARQVAMFLARKLLGRPFAELATAFDRDHTTVLHACRAVAARLEKDPAFRAVVARLEQQLGGEEEP
ncbi:MAG TPA: DnaA/Hda family protein [Gaiellaceae bacterium]|nr:DnaA/Hda family protein [Gaiellaceae bacterium]